MKCHCDEIEELRDKISNAEKALKELKARISDGILRAHFYSTDRDKALDQVVEDIQTAIAFTQGSKVARERS